MEPEKEGSSRVLTQFISNMIHGDPIQLVDGGEQKRCYTYVDDGIDGLMRIIENKNDVCNGQIFNIGNPKNEATVRELAHKVRDLFMSYPEYSHKGLPEITEVSSGDVLRQGIPGHEPESPLYQEGKRNSWVGAGRRPRYGPQEDDGLSIWRRPASMAPVDRLEWKSGWDKVIGLNVHVDTFEGMRHGVPRLLDLFRARAIRTTFFVPMGKDHTGWTVKRVFTRRGFVSKTRRAGVIETFGVKTLMRGLLLPGTEIATRNAPILKRIRDAGPRSWAFTGSITCTGTTTSKKWGSHAPMPPLGRHSVLSNRYSATSPALSLPRAG